MPKAAVIYQHHKTMLTLASSTSSLRARDARPNIIGGLRDASDVCVRKVAELRKVDPLLAKSHLKILLCLTPEDFSLSNARRFYSSKGDPLELTGLKDDRPTSHLHNEILHYNP